MASTRRWIDDKVLPSNPRHTRWCILVPKKVNIFMWRLMLDKIPTRVELERKNIVLTSNLCPLCGLEEEKIDHLFIRCDVAARTWEALFKWLDIQVANFRDPSELIFMIDTVKISTPKKQNILAVVYTAFWFLWKYRNDLVHDSEKITKSVIVGSIQEFVFFCGFQVGRKNLLFNGVFGSKTPKLFVIV